MAITRCREWSWFEDANIRGNDEEDGIASMLSNGDSPCILLDAWENHESCHVLLSPLKARAFAAELLRLASILDGGVEDVK